MQDPIREIHHKINEFVKKFYLNKMIKGGIIFIVLMGILVLLAATLEYFLRLSTTGRTWLFYLSLLITIVLAISLWFLPLLKYFRIGKTLSHTDASEMIGEHFSEISDKLHNLLDLSQQSKKDTSHLLLASIQQKIEEIKPFDFRLVIDFNQSIKYLKYILIPFGVFALFWVSGNKEIITESAERIVQFDEEFIPEAPFDFVIKNDSLQTHSSKDFLLTVGLKGERLPKEMEIKLSGQWFKMQDLLNNEFNYQFTNLQESIPFQLKSDGYSSKTYQIKVLPFPEIDYFSVEIKAPNYTKIPLRKIENTGDLQIPEGSWISWKVRSEKGKEIQFNFEDTSFVSTKKDENFVLKRQIFTSGKYELSPSNDFVQNGEKISYRMQIVKDAHPQISVAQEIDSKQENQQLFKGKISDDYGFKKLDFVFEIDGKINRKSLEIKKDWNQQEFVYLFNLDDYELNGGEKIDYYFEVFDNDGIHGSKAVKSKRFHIQTPDAEAIADEAEENNEEAEKALEERLKEARELNEEFKRLQAKLLQKKNLNWEDKEQIKQLLEKQKKLENSIKELQKENKKSIENLKKYNKENEKLLKKQEQIQDLMEDILDEETKKLFEDIQKMMEKLDKKEIQKNLEKLKENNESVEKELDRSLEMLKQFQFEQKLEENIQKLEELQKKQEELAKKNEEQEADKKTSDAEKEALKKEQEALNKEFEKWQEEMKKMEKLNEKLEQPNNLQDTKKEQEDIKKEMQKSSEQMQKNNKKQSKKSQKKASEKMEELKEQMLQMQSGMASEQIMEDMETLRQILENLVDLSFEEEALVKRISETGNQDPYYIELIKKQSDIRFKSEMVADSLFALSKRQVSIEKTVRKEVVGLEKNLKNSLYYLTERKSNPAKSSGQYAMTSANNLALLLSQILDQMQQSMNNPNKSSGQCNKPNPFNQSSKPSMKGMKKMQQQMKKRLKSLQQQLLNEGKKQGKKQGKEGEKKQSGGAQGMSQELVKTAAQQEAIRRKLEEISKSMENGEEEGGQGHKSLKEAIQKMKEIERDIVNKNINPETLRRQEEIMQKMLEAEKAEREQEKEKKRKSKEAEQQQREQSEVWKKYLEEKKKQKEIFHQKPINYQPYYKKKVEEYFQNN